METDKEILQYYKYAYTCTCGQKYGADKKEKAPYLCPMCEEKLQK